MRRAVAWLVVSVLVSLVLTGALNGLTVTDIAVVPRVAGPVVTSTDELHDLARQQCAAVLDQRTCDDTPLEVSDSPLGGDAEGATEIVTTIESAPGVPDRSEVTARRVVLNSHLVGREVAAARFVATHEWNHVQQVHRFPDGDAYRDLERRANAHFGLRATTPLTDSMGLEVLIDCATHLGDRVTFDGGDYLHLWMGVRRPGDIAAACAGWDTLLG